MYTTRCTLRHCAATHKNEQHKVNEHNMGIFSHRSRLMPRSHCPHAIKDDLSGGDSMPQ